MSHGFTGILVSHTHFLPVSRMPSDGCIDHAVLSLPEEYRVAIYLHYYEGYSIREIAVMTKKTEAATAQYLARGRAKLRKKLGGVES